MTRRVRGGLIRAIAPALALGCMVAAQPAMATHTGYPAGDPGGDENANLPIPPPGGQFFGLNDDYVDYAHHQSPESYARYVYSTGANAVKMSLEWWRAERFQDDEWIVRRWDVWQDVYDALRARGITPVFILSSAPCWARSVPCAPGDPAEPRRFPPTPAFDDEWGEFVAEVARRFPESIIQAWNEPNLLTWWRDGVNPERYVQVLQAAKTAVDAVETDLGGIEIPVAGPGITNALTVADPSNMTMTEFLNRAYTAGMKDYTDATSFNVFPLAHAPFGPDQEFGAGTRFAESFRQLRLARTNAGETDPIFVTETGIVAQVPEEPAFPYTQRQQAESMLRLYNRILTMPDVEMMIAHRLIEPRGVNHEPVEWGFAWLRHAPAPDGQDPQTQAPGLPQPKAVYCVFSHQAYLSSGADPASRDPERFYEPCGIVISDSVRNGDGSWTFTYSAPNYNHRYRDLQCQVDAGPFGPCDSFSSHTTAPLGPGLHTFSVRPIDIDLNPLPATELSFPDNVVPIVQFDSGPAPGSTTFDSTPTVEFSSSEPGTFECRLDGAPAVACTSPWTLKPEDALSDAIHTLQVVAIDAAGNRSAPIQRSFRVEAAFPVVTIDSGPASGSKTSDSTPTITFSASEAATFECSYDGGAPVACNSGSFTPATPLPDGPHTFSVTATDTAGNDSLAAATRTFTVDTVKPTASIVSGPAQDSTISNPTPTFSFASNEPGSTFQCALNVPTYSACSGPGASHTTAPLVDGDYLLAVRAVDQAGNVGDPVFRGFTVEKPNTKITGLKVSSRKRTAKVAFKATAGVEPASFECKIDKKPFKDCETPKKFKRLKPGKHKVQVRAISADGVTDATPAKERFKIRR